jgi:hypothetical protein
MEPVKVVAHYLNGELIKGSTQDFSPNKPLFHIYPTTKSNGEGIKVLMKDLKAVFFVRDFVGDSTYNERKHFKDGENVPGKKLEVLFADDELLVGSTLGYDPNRQGFFLFPADSQTNNIRIFSIASALKKVHFL